MRVIWTAKCELSNVTVHSITRSRAFSQSRASKPPLKRSPCALFSTGLRWSPPLAWARMSSWEGAALDNIVQAIDSHNFFRGCTTPRGHPDHSRGHARSLIDDGTCTKEVVCINNSDNRRGSLNGTTATTTRLFSARCPGLDDRNWDKKQTGVPT